MHLAALVGQVEYRPAPVCVGELAINAPSADQLGDRPTDRHFIHQGAVCNLDGRQPGIPPQDGDDPPLGDRDPEPFLVDARDIRADAMRCDG